MRNKRLDVLRCVAVLLVIVAHSQLPGQLTSAGRFGVDLFFVLSVFLISGLLFLEQKKHGSISFQRFFVRRSLKIYPAFYFLLSATLAYQLMFHQVAPVGRYLSAIFYVQNYTSQIWGHEWSLAVEEHFYVLLPLFLLFCIRRFPEARDPFHRVPLTFLIVALACLSLRVITVMKLPREYLQIWEGYHWAYATTHCRMDSLFFGVLLGYFHHFRPEILTTLTNSRAKCLALLCLSVLLLCPSLLFPPTSRAMLTLGHTGLYFGFGIVLLLSLQLSHILPPVLARPVELIGAIFAKIGVYSYSIYLWHLPVSVWGLTFARKVLRFQIGLKTGFVLYALGSIALGVFFSKTLEYPVLRLRDRFFPSMAGPGATSS